METLKRKALEFANLYAPPVDYSSFHLFSQQGVSLSHFAAESLLLWWVLHLKAQLASPKPSLREALTAVAQIYWFFPVAKAGRVVTFYSSEWTKLLSSFVVQVTEETAAGERQAPPIPTKPMSREGGFPPTSYEVCGLPPKELAPIVDGLLESHEHDKGRLWQLAHNAFATVVNVRLTGVTLMCLPAGERPTAAPSVGFQFLTPLARIWYGLWEDVAGLRIRHCARAQCGRFFIPNRKDKRFCSPRCQNAEKVAGWRKAQAEKSRKASARKGKASKISSSSR